MEIHQSLQALATRRPIFHSEADFQHALAWQLKLLNGDVDVRLEIPADFPGQERASIDMLTRRDGLTTFYELKYKTNLTKVTHGGELFRLKRQGAQDQGKYDFLRDIARIETFVERESGSSGYAILLTNDPSYWTRRLKANAIDTDFELSDGRTLSWQLQWTGEFSKGSIKGREAPITLRGSYPVAWRDYPGTPLPGCDPFRYLSFHVTA